MSIPSNGLPARSQVSKRRVPFRAYWHSIEPRNIFSSKRRGEESVVKRREAAFAPVLGGKCKEDQVYVPLYIT